MQASPSCSSTNPVQVQFTLLFKRISSLRFRLEFRGLIKGQLKDKSLWSSIWVCKSSRVSRLTTTNPHKHRSDLRQQSFSTLVPLKRPSYKFIEELANPEGSSLSRCCTNYHRAPVRSLLTRSLPQSSSECPFTSPALLSTWDSTFHSQQGVHRPVHPRDVGPYLSGLVMQSTAQD